MPTKIEGISPEVLSAADHKAVAQQVGPDRALTTEELKMVPATELSRLKQELVSGENSTLQENLDQPTRQALLDLINEVQKGTTAGGSGAAAPGANPDILTSNPALKKVDDILAEFDSLQAYQADHPILHADDHMLGAWATRDYAGIERLQYEHLGRAATHMLNWAAPNNPFAVSTPETADNVLNYNKPAMRALLTEIANQYGNTTKNAQGKFVLTIGQREVPYDSQAARDAAIMEMLSLSQTTIADEKKSGVLIGTIGGIFISYAILKSFSTVIRKVPYGGAKIAKGIDITLIPFERTYQFLKDRLPRVGDKGKGYLNAVRERRDARRGESDMRRYTQAEVDADPKLQSRQLEQLKAAEGVMYEDLYRREGAKIRASNGSLDSAEKFRDHMQTGGASDFPKYESDVANASRARIKKLLPIPEVSHQTAASRLAFNARVAELAHAINPSSFRSVYPRLTNIFLVGNAVEWLASKGDFGAFHPDHILRQSGLAGALRDGVTIEIDGVRLENMPPTLPNPAVGQPPIKTEDAIRDLMRAMELQSAIDLIDQTVASEAEVHRLEGEIEALKQRGIPDTDIELQDRIKRLEDARMNYARYASMQSSLDTARAAVTAQTSAVEAIQGDIATNTAAQEALQTERTAVSEYEKSANEKNKADQAKNKADADVQKQRITVKNRLTSVEATLTGQGVKGVTSFTADVMDADFTDQATKYRDTLMSQVNSHNAPLHASKKIDANTYVTNPLENPITRLESLDLDLKNATDALSTAEQALVARQVELENANLWDSTKDAPTRSGSELATEQRRLEGEARNLATQLAQAENAQRTAEAAKTRAKTQVSATPAMATNHGGVMYEPSIGQPDGTKTRIARTEAQLSAQTQQARDMQQHTQERARRTAALPQQRQRAADAARAAGQQLPADAAFTPSSGTKSPELQAAEAGLRAGLVTTGTSLGALNAQLRAGFRLNVTPDGKVEIVNTGTGRVEMRGTREEFLRDIHRLRAFLKR